MKVDKRPTIRKILVPLDPSDYAKSATDYACRISHAFDATVAGLTVLDSPEIRASAFPSQYGYAALVQESIELHKDNAQKEIDKIEGRFLEYCREQKVLASEVEEDGIPADLILEAATLFDLVVVGLRTFFHFETRRGDGELLTKILGRISTPILAVPARPKPLERVLIAYDGSPASARAVRDFTLFARPFDMEVDLFLADDDKGRLDFHANKLQYYLTDHGIPVRKVVRYSDGPLVAIGDGLTKNYDLVVCGMHSRKPLRDFFVGSFVKMLIERQENALFLSH
ncbi:universal stress protein (plasmid) [Verrucomicrobiaceae bacterium 227]